MVLFGQGRWWMGRLDRMAILASVSSLSGFKGSGASMGVYA